MLQHNQNLKKKLCSFLNTKKIHLVDFQTLQQQQQRSRRKDKMIIDHEIDFPLI